MDKTTLTWLAVTLGILGAAVTSGHPAWGTITGVAVLLLAGAVAVGAFTAEAAPARSGDSTADRKGGSQRISNSLATLSSAAIIAVYAAGYHRTGSAIAEFEAQSARRKELAPLAATISLPIATAADATSPAATPLKKERSRSASVASHKEKSASAEHSNATPDSPTAATPSTDSAATDSTGSAKKHYKDGTFLGWGTSLHGDIQASVVIKDGQIVSTAIAVCATRYSCSWIENLPAKVIAGQSAYVDFVSGATESSDAFMYAVASALNKARG